MGFKKPILNWKIGVSIIDIVLTPFLLFGFWIIEYYGDFTFGKYSFEGWCWATGLSFAYTYNSFLNLLNTPEWNRINRKRCRRNIFYGTLITSQSVMSYYTGGGFDWIDILIGVGAFIILANLWKYLKKILPRQKDVQKYIWINDILADGMNDKVLNPCYLMKHCCYKILQDHRDNKKLRKSIFFLLNKLDEQDQITTRLLKMHNLSKDE